MSFDKLAGIYVYCMNYHSGQNSRLYRLMSKINIHLTDTAIRIISDGFHSMDEINFYAEYIESHRVYNTLVKRNAK